jgi:hypothetical protein
MPAPSAPSSTNRPVQPSVSALMAERTGSPANSHAWATTLAIFMVYAALIVGSFLLVLAGRGRFGPGWEGTEIAGWIGLFVGIASAPIAALLDARRRADNTQRLARSLDLVGESIRRLNDQAGLSDDARRVLNRSLERDLLCRAIEEDISAQSWDAALVLCNELADRFGYRADAEEFRARIELARSEVLERRVSDAIARLDGLIVQRRWDVALREAQRIQRLFPDSHRVENLRQRVEQARNVYKHDLERRFLDASSAGRAEEALTLLKELDLYLTQTEAEPLRELARGVVGKARENLGAQFKIAVQDRQWAQAAALGRRIINEFPNTRMAAEVRQMMDGILARANAPHAEPVSSRG